MVYEAPGGSLRSSAVMPKCPLAISCPTPGQTKQNCCPLALCSLKASEVWFCPKPLTLCFGTWGSQLCLAGRWDTHRVSVAHCSVTFAILCCSFPGAELHISLPPTVPQDKPHVFSLGIFKLTFEFSHSSVFWGYQQLTPLISL